MQYIENKYSLSVGYGYRLLGPEEITKNGDEHFNGYQWFAIPSYRCGETCKDYTSAKGIRRKIDVGAGYRMLDINEIIQENDEVITYHHIWSNCFWGCSHRVGERPFDNVDMEKLGVAYRRKVQYESQVLEQGIEELKKLKEKTAKLEQELADCKKEFKIGGYVKIMSNGSGVAFGKIGKIYSKSSETYQQLFKITLKDNQFISLPSGFVKATRAEIEKHLLEEAEKAGYVVGAFVDIEYRYNGKLWQERAKKIENISVVFPGDSRRTSNLVRAEIIKAPFVVIKSSNFRFTPIFYTKIVNPGIGITVDGQSYFAEFFSGFVKFGCAHISNQQIRDSLRLFNVTYSNSNKNIESVKIGKGIFTKEILEKLAAKLIG